MVLISVSIMPKFGESITCTEMHFLAQTRQIYIYHQILLNRTLHVIMLKTRESLFFFLKDTPPLFLYAIKMVANLAEIAKFF